MSKAYATSAAVDEATSYRTSKGLSRVPATFSYQVARVICGGGARGYPGVRKGIDEDEDDDDGGSGAGTAARGPW